MLTPEEAMATLQLINRVSVNGQEVEAVVALKQKLQQIAQPQPTVTEEFEDVKTTNKK